MIPHLFVRAISSSLARLGRTDVDPGHVEAYILRDHGSVAHLAVVGFPRAVRDALAAYDADTPEQRLALATKHGFR